ncbi:WbqC family protein [Sinomicrobium sp.]
MSRQVLIHPTYFPSILHMVALVNCDTVFEMHDNFQKQTYRNRMYIYGAGGKQLLSIPVKHLKTGAHQKYKDVRIEEESTWAKLHWKTLQTAYRSSPFFEFYEDDLAGIFHQKHDFLMDLNLATINLICEILQIELKQTFTTEYQKETTELEDFRHLVNAKEEPHFKLSPYTQVFEEKHGHIPNLSILDLLFNEGPNATSYLKDQELPR